MSLSAMDIPIAAIKSQITSALDIIIHLGRLNDKSRRVLEITEIDSFDGTNIILNPIFTYDYSSGLIPTGNKLIHKSKLLQHGYDVWGGATWIIKNTLYVPESFWYMGLYIF